MWKYNVLFCQYEIIRPRSTFLYDAEVGYNLG